MEKLLKQKKFFVAVLGIVLGLIFLTGTLAWRDFSQHKTNEASGDGIMYDVSLIEEYETITNWKVTDPEQTKKIMVKNMGKDDTYGQLYVRLQLKEYMEISEDGVEYSEQRFMLDKNGEFITFSDEDEAEKAYPIAEYEREKHQILGDDQERWYIALPPNEEYGKFLPLRFQKGEPVPLVEGSIRAQEDNRYQHEENDACNYKIHTWKDEAEIEDPFHEFVDWILNDQEIIEMNQWDGNPAPVWIADTQSAEGYIYWGQPLKVGETTSSFFQALKLRKQPSGSFYYALHVDMEALPVDEVDDSWIF